MRLTLATPNFATSPNRLLIPGRALSASINTASIGCDPLATMANVSSRENAFISF
jgi:hypothetical protein